MDLTVPYKSLDSSLPSFFDLMAKDSARASMETIFKYFMTQLTDGFPSLREYLPYADVVYSFLLGGIDIAYICSYDATLVEHYFGLRRCDIHSPAARGEITSDGRADQLSRRGKAASIIEVIGNILWCRVIATFRNGSESFRSINSAVTRVTCHSIPWMHAFFALAKVFLSIAYSQQQVLTISPALWALSINLVNVSSADIQRFSRKVLDSRVRITILLLAILGKLCLWCFGTGDNSPEQEKEKINWGKKAYMVPPPPEIEGPSVANLNICPICERPMTNQTLNVASGRIFCYPCIHKHVESEGNCPVTGIKTKVAQLRRLFLSE
mmetsp:Transcript_33746/g.52779  ORF Transcript_33746/g.52779 Transcript_33746/m.52779 type:complete len:325 (-) Transcript_33746:24-998(-)